MLLSFLFSSVPEHMRIAGTEPVTLPTCIVPTKHLHKRYSLPQKARDTAPLIHQLAALKRWSTTPIQLDRDCGAIGSRTLKNLLTDIFLYLGYLHHFHNQSSPHLEAFLSLDQYAAYISFQVAKGNSHTSLAHQLAHAKRVTQFLARGPGSGLQQSVAAMHTWLHRLRGQLTSLLTRPRADVGQLEEDGAWMDARTIVTALESFRLETLRELPEYGEYSLYTARLLHDACLVNTLFGYLPPVRVACIRHLQLPSTTDGCLDPDCRIPACRGNRLEFKPDGLYMCLPHHKNQKK